MAPSQYSGFKPIEHEKIIVNPPIRYLITCQSLPYTKSVNEIPLPPKNVRCNLCNLQILWAPFCTSLISGYSLISEVAMVDPSDFGAVLITMRGRGGGPPQCRGAHGERGVLQRCAESGAVQFSHQHRPWLGWVLTGYPLVMTNMENPENHHFLWDNPP